MLFHIILCVAAELPAELAFLIALLQLAMDDKSAPNLNSFITSFWRQ